MVKSNAIGNRQWCHQRGRFRALLHRRIRIVVGYEVQDNAMLQERFAAGQEKAEAAHRVDGPRDLFVIGSFKARRGDTHKGGVVTSGSELPFDWTWPLDED